MSAALDYHVPPNDDWLFALETPCYVFDPQAVLESYATLRERLGTKLVVSLKANSHVDLFVRCGHAFTDGVELASLGELDVVVGRGKIPKYLNNPSMNEAFIRAGLASRCHFILDNPDLAHRFAALAAGKATGDVLLRMNAGALASTDARKEWHDHFGMTPHEAFQVAEMLSAAGIRVKGLHVFSGSHTFRAGRRVDDGPDSADLALALARFAEELARVTGTPLTFLNLGGGFSEKGHERPVFDRYRERIVPVVDRYEVAHESGRGVFAHAGVFVTRVVAVKRWWDRTIAVCDGGMSHNFLLAKTESMLKTWQAPRVVPRSAPRAVTRIRSTPLSFVGSTCSRADVIGRITEPTVVPEPGDLLVFEGCGAYNRTYTVGGFLSHQPAHVYIRQA